MINITNKLVIGKYHVVELLSNIKLESRVDPIVCWTVMDVTMNYVMIKSTYLVFISGLVLTTGGSIQF